MTNNTSIDTTISPVSGLALLLWAGIAIKMVQGRFLNALDALVAISASFGMPMVIAFLILLVVSGAIAFMCAAQLALRGLAMAFDFAIGRLERKAPRG